jgi:hypothetical protein
MSNCAHGRLPDRCTECAKQTHIDQLESVTALLRKEKEVYEESSRFWKGMAQYAYQRSTDALMIPPQKAGEARDARDNALCDINKKLGGVLR